MNDFIRKQINQDLEKGKISTVVTRFPPEPNGFLHIGHAKAIFINYNIANEYNGLWRLRFDDTNPVKEKDCYVNSIKQDVAWLIDNNNFEIRYASDYFDKFYNFALELIKAGKAYVDDNSIDEIRKLRGSLTKPGINSIYRNRTIEENLILFEAMKNGEKQQGSCVLRAKIDMESPNINLRDPIIYRIIKVSHHRKGDKWCIYPSYDFAHGFEDYIEQVSHSLCSLEFEDHRPLYNWFIDNVTTTGIKPQQIEFARLFLSNTVLNKRKLIWLIENGYVDGWDDPRILTISGLRRRGCTPSMLKNFCQAVGISKENSLVDIQMLDFFIREELNLTAPRAMAIFDPIKLIIENYPEDKQEQIKCYVNPANKEQGSRKSSFSKELFIEKNDFMEHPIKGFKRLSVGQEVRLQYAYYITCTGFDKDEHGNITTIYATYDKDSKGGQSKDNRKVKGTIHWVSAYKDNYSKATVNLYQNIFTEKNMNKFSNEEFVHYFNQKSKIVINNVIVEKYLTKANKLESFQFMRQGYFCADMKNHNLNNLEFNLIVGLKNSWNKTN